MNSQAKRSKIQEALQAWAEEASSQPQGPYQELFAIEAKVAPGSLPVIKVNSQDYNTFFTINLPPIFSVSAAPEIAAWGLDQAFKSHIEPDRTPGAFLLAQILNKADSLALTSIQSDRYLLDSIQVRLLPEKYKDTSNLYAFWSFYCLDTETYLEYPAYPPWAAVLHKMGTLKAEEMKAAALREVRDSYNTFLNSFKF